jgi:hypothetical protein
MRVVAFDPSKTTGWAYWDTSRDHSSIQCGVFKMPEKADHYYTSDQIGLKVKDFLRDLTADPNFGKPDFAILEEQSLAKIGNTSADAMIYPWIASTAIASTLANFNIPYSTSPAATWRVVFFGSGFKPPFKIRKLKKPDPKTGKTEKTEWLWKEACVTECERRGITIPSNKETGHNAAEAAALAMCAQSDKTKIHAGRYEAAWKAIRNTKFKSADLFEGAAA